MTDVRVGRPGGITVLSLILGWLAFGGLANAVIWNLPRVQAMFAQFKPPRVVPSGVLFTAVMLAYGLAAGAASVALWRMHRLAARAYALWCFTVMLSGLYLVWCGFEPNVTAGLLFAFGGAGFVALALPYIAART
ncbi:MAG TPA: hypothetical protein VJS12_20135 [Steroidobacteraceae bacterium]|nr:hypothetical protein [Steroidobacteraceae bacterium]